jgi:hypothetical protein
MTGDRLSRLVSEWRQIHRMAEEMHEDLNIWYAPSECSHDLWKSVDRMMENFFENHNLTWEEFKAAVIARTSYRWAYYNL